MDLAHQSTTDCASLGGHIRCVAHLNRCTQGSNRVRGSTLGDWIFLFFCQPRKRLANSAEEVRHWCKQRLAGFKCPTSVSFIADADMPRTATGKIQHRMLKARLSASARLRACKGGFMGGLVTCHVVLSRVGVRMVCVTSIGCKAMAMRHQTPQQQFYSYPANW